MRDCPVSTHPRHQLTHVHGQKHGQNSPPGRVFSCNERQDATRRRASRFARCHGEGGRAALARRAGKAVDVERAVLRNLAGSSEQTPPAAWSYGRGPRNHVCSATPLGCSRFGQKSQSEGRASVSRCLVIAVITSPVNGRRQYWATSRCRSRAGHIITASIRIARSGSSTVDSSLLMNGICLIRFQAHWTAVFISASLIGERAPWSPRVVMIADATKSGIRSSWCRSSASAWANAASRSHQKWSRSARRRSAR
ncbi:MAG: hypothetical protein QOI21_2517 [Actinomycetota bacterium]|nr:hypothetical protein [Actinomycetota bacterium]